MSLQRFSIRCTSDFALYNRWFSGEDVTPVLEQRQSLGFNSCRVWTAFDIPMIGTCDPHRPDFYARWPEFMDLLNEFELYAEITAFTGPYPYFPNSQSMIDHWNALEAAVAPSVNLLDLEAINEYDNAPNAGVPLDLLRQPSCLSSHGSAIQDAPPKEPHWTMAGWRSPFEQWWRKTSHDAMDWANAWGIPVWTNEFPRTDNDANLNHWFDSAAAGTLLCAGAGCFHSPSGKDSTLFEGVELECAKSFISGALTVPLEFQAGQYSRIDPNPPGILRIYRRTLSDGRFWEVRIRE